MELGINDESVVKRILSNLNPSSLIQTLMTCSPDVMSMVAGMASIVLLRHTQLFVVKLILSDVAISLPSKPTWTESSLPPVANPLTQTRYVPPAVKLTL